MRIGIFGGTFNPIHMGHLIIADHILDAASLDKIIFIPAAYPPHKEAKLKYTAQHRYEMVELAIRGNERFEISDMEIKKPSISYTVETLRELKKTYHDDQLYFIIGADTFYELGTWYDLPGILEIAEFLVIRRLGLGEDQLTRLDQAIEDFSVIFDANISLVEAPLIQISSTLIREKCKNNKSIHYLVTEEVRQYIEERNLYE